MDSLSLNVVEGENENAKDKDPVIILPFLGLMFAGLWI